MFGYKSGLEDVNEKLKSGVATLEDYSKKVKDFSDSTGKIGNSLTKNVTAPITAAGAGVMAAWAQVDEGMDIIVQKTGATGDALEEMQNSARNIAKTIPTDFEAAGTAVGEVNTRFHLTGEELEDLSAKFIKFAELNGTDVNSSIDSTQKVIEAFNLSAEDAGALLDTMNKVGQDTGISMDTLASSMVSNAAALKELGMSAADAATFLGQCETSGVDTSAVMAGLKKALVNASKEGKSMKNALSELQDTMVNAGSSSEAYNAAVELFGAKAGPALAEFCQSGKLNFDELGASLNDNLGSVNDTFEATLDPADQFKLTLNQLKDAGFDVGNALGPVLAECLQMVTPILKDIITVNYHLHFADDAQKETQSLLRHTKMAGSGACLTREQLKAIHTNYPTTVLTSENEISVEYVADTEAYIEKRIKEENQSLQKQILEIQNALISQKISGV